jgi:hypothetical protein
MNYSLFYPGPETGSVAPAKFLHVPTSSTYLEWDLEQALIDKL